MKRKQYIDWLATSFGIFGTVYGAYLLIWNYNHGNGLNVLALILLILGSIALVFSIALLISRYIVYKKNKNRAVPIEAETIKEEIFEETSLDEDEDIVETIKEAPKERTDYVERRSRSSSSYYGSPTIYVRQVGYGPLLRIEGSRILDMRTSTYYRIEGNLIKQEGYGPRFEIIGNNIKDAFGGYLYELSGSNINKVFGGFYASISGNYITLYDSSYKYEITDSLSNKQILAVVALLFDK